MTIMEAVAEAGVSINAKNMPDKNPTKDAFSRVIDASRKAETVAGAVIASRDETIASLMLKLQKSEAENMSHRLKNALEGDAFEKLNRAEKQQLLEVVA